MFNGCLKCAMNVSHTMRQMYVFPNSWLTHGKKGVLNMWCSVLYATFHGYCLGMAMVECLGFWRRVGGTGVRTRVSLLRFQRLDIACSQVVI